MPKPDADANAAVDIVDDAANAANAANANKAIAKTANEPKEAEAIASNMDDDKTVVYPSMFDRWKEPL
jgi:hypothetical protein